MTSFPRLTSGGIGFRGKVTWRHFMRIFRTVERIEPLLKVLERLTNRARKERHTLAFWAMIDENSPVGGATNQWRYSWIEMRLSDNAWETWPEARTGSFIGFGGPTYALNTVEASNDGLGIEAPGVDVDGPDYPAGFSLQPIQGQPIVWLRAFRSVEGGVRYAFTLANDHDGTCAG